MKQKKIFKAIVVILFVLLVSFCLYNVATIFRVGKQEITISTASQLYRNSNLEAQIDVTDKNDNSIKGNVKFELLKDGKKVKGMTSNYKKQEDQKLQIALPISEDIETGKYSIKVTATSKMGLLKEVATLPVEILNENDSKVLISLDKGIYKPGDEVCFRALLVSKKDSKPIENEVKICIYDGNNNKVYSKEMDTSEYGIVSGKFELADEVNSGTYRLVVSTNTTEVTKNFTVNPYIVPQFETTISTDKENYIVGEIATITVGAKYFFGEPVVNASITGTINENEIVGLTDANGNFTTNYQILDKGKIDVKLNVTDTSNYLVEAEKSLFASTDVFEIEVLPEYGNIIRNLDNDIYVFTKTIDGKPVKTHSTINIGNITRQVISNESGIGCFTLTSSDVDSLTDGKIKISSENSNSQKVEKQISLLLERNPGVLIETDKIKYNVGDNLNIKLNSNLDLTQKEVYFYKGKELIKTVSSENGEIGVNLGDASGIIDIYVKNDNLIHNYKNATMVNSENIEDYSKKTIFIKPNKALNIDIKLDDEEYAPGEKINIEFNVSDEKNNEMDSSLLVSILDEAILNLAENDLSIDNVKLALDDIELTNGVTASDLYANIMDDSNPELLNAVLLRQKYTDPNLYEYRSTTLRYEKNEYVIKAIYSFIAIVILALVVGMIKELKKENKSRKIAKFVANSVNMLIIFIIITIGLYEPIEELYYKITYLYTELLAILTNIVLTIVLYLLVLYKQRDYIFKTILDLLIIPSVYFLVIYIVASILDTELLIIFILLILFAVWAILVKISRDKELNEKLSFFKYTLTQLFKSIVVYFAIYAVANMFESVLGFYAVLVAYILLDKYIFGKTKIKMENHQIDLNTTQGELITIGIGVLFVLTLFTGIRLIINNFGASTINDSMSTVPDIVFDYNAGSSSGDIYIDTIDSTESSTKGFSFEDIFETNKKQEAILEAPESSYENVKSEEIERTEEVVENVRNVFLESLAFIPELVTQKGYANLELDLSDNITTWNIQTVGNSKEGNIGYSSKTFKVFKEFFIDYSLPVNSVVTDKVEIPVTLYNYTQSELDIDVNVVQNDWSNIGEYKKQVTVAPNSTQMIYVPIEILKAGNNTLRVESSIKNLSDIVEKNMLVSENGIKIEQVVSSGMMQNTLSQDIIYNDNALSGTKDLKVKLYASSITQVIENIENILQLPTGCFEQTSSSLYPDILVLKYLENNDLDNQELKAKALDYISKGYQKLLTYEVKEAKGGYSLYGNSPAETVITAYGLMEFMDLSEVYDVDEVVIQNMKDFLFKQQKINGSFDYSSTYVGGLESTDELAMNAYIIWALSEACPDDERLEKSVDYLIKNIDNANDDYHLSLMANVFANVDDSSNYKKVINKLLNNVKQDGDCAYIQSNIRDYYGCWGKYQDMQTTALTSMALTKLDQNGKTNQALINYLIREKSANGTWGTTQGTILSLKAINAFEVNSDISGQTIAVRLNDKVESVDINKNALDIYEFDFEDLSEENKLSIEMKKGKIAYEIIKEYYRSYDEAQFNQDVKSSGKLIVNQELTTIAKVNDEISQKIHVTNKTGSSISNGLVQINIPQGCSVNEETLMLMKHNKLIEKYEYNYGKINLYLRDFENDGERNLEIKYKALYPETVTGGAVRVFDYYNPEIETICMPQVINVSK